MRLQRLFCLVGFALATAPVIAQELVPVGPPVEMRPVKTDGNFAFDPKVAVSTGDGSFMAVWFETMGNSPYSIQARRSGPAGQPLDPAPVQANTTTAGFQGYQTVAANRNGEFLVVWAGSPSESEYTFDVFGQRFDRNGNRLGGQATFNQDASGAESPSVAMAPGGEFAVGWERYFSYEVGFRRFDAAGAPLQPDTRANTYTTGNQFYAGVAIDPADGTSLVAWVSQDQFSAADTGCTPASWSRFWRHDVVARRYDASGLPIGDEVLLSTPRPWGQRLQRPAVVALGFGEFLVAWLDMPPCDATAPRVVKGRVVRADGSLGEELALSDATMTARSYPLLAPDPAGRGFLAGWMESGRWLVRRFDRRGVPYGSDAFVTPALASSEYLGGFGMATDGAGNLVAVWDQVLDLSTSSVPYNYEHHLLAQVWALPDTLTPTGENVTARPVDPVSDTLPVQLTFSTVTVPGTTSVTSSTVPPSPVPSGFSVGDPAVYYDVTTTAAFQGTIQVCFSYAGVTFPAGQDPRLLHYENGTYTDVTTSFDPARQIVCGETATLSPFTVASLAVRPVGIDVKPGSWPNSINVGSNGKTPVAVLGAVAFDARTVDPLSLVFAGAPVLRLPNGQPMVGTEDVNRDGRVDLVAHFSTRALKLIPTDTTAMLEGRTRDSKRIRGIDAVRVVK